MSDQTPSVLRLAMVGEAEAPVCVDGVCEVAPAADAPKVPDDAPPG